MNIIDIINKKRLGQLLSKEELAYAFLGYLKGNIESYQMSSLLMAICIQGMRDDEIIWLTHIFIESGEILDLSAISGIKVDKHSTGGIGDKTTLVIAPIIASCGVKIAKMSGRGLGYTGGTIDKLESIPGLKTSLSKEQFLLELKDIGMVISGQTSELAPLDKKIYALRDVTATVESYPLIATSIMSKKIASGADKILIDLKVGNGALIHNLEDAKKLSSIMERIGAYFNKETRVIITNMNEPLGYCIGNSLEVYEAMEVLKGKIESDLGKLCIELATNLVAMGKDATLEQAHQQVIEVINNGQAYQKFIEFVKYQQGDITNLKISADTIEVRSKKEGRVDEISARMIGEISMKLGAGRQTKDDIIDPSVGIVLNKKVGDFVEKGELLCTLYVNKVKDTYQIEDAFVINENIS